jgi:hypothetical protein
MSSYLKYIGRDKGIIPGIPARDLTEKEAKDIGVAHLLQSGLYVRVTPPAPVVAEETKEEPAPEEAKPTKRKRARKE